MIRPVDRKRALDLRSALLAKDAADQSLPGIRPAGHLSALIGQMIESERRVRYIRTLLTRPIQAAAADPSSATFDPLKAAIFHMRQGNLEEAFWLVFVFVHCGKHLRDRFLLAAEIYGGLGGDTWTWARIIADPNAFLDWLRRNEGNFSGKFGNHRRYETMKATSARGAPAVFSSYLRWTGGSHLALLRKAQGAVGQHPETLFDHLYVGMEEVVSFGRLGRFDYLTMLDKLGLAPIKAGSTYLAGATGPLRGAKLLYLGRPDQSADVRVLELSLNELGEVLELGQQEIEDSLCNWQKSPAKFVAFRG